MTLKGQSCFLATALLLLIWPSMAWPTPPEKTATTSPAHVEEEAATEDEAVISDTRNQIQKDTSGVLRLMCKEVMPIEVSWKGETYETWPGDALQIPAARSTIRVKARGYFPRESDLGISNSAVTTLEYELEPIPNYEWKAIAGWVGLGLGLVLSVGAIAVQDSVDFDSPAKREAAQWSLLGTGGALLFSGGLLAKDAYSMDQRAPTRPF